jgi:polar amino acid transport system substrate-binding protein
MLRLMLAALTLVALVSGAGAQTVRLATEGAYPPFNYVDDAGLVGGLDIELGNELCRRAGLACEWVVNEWDSIIPNLLAGNYDAVIADLTITAERRATVDFTAPYFPPDPSTWLSRAGTSFDYAALTGLRLGAQSGTVQTAWLKENLEAGNTLLGYNTVDQAVADLSAGNLDLVLAEASYLGEQVAASGGALKADGPAIPIGEGAGIALRKADADLRARFDAALAEAKADGWLDALIGKYFPGLGPGPYFLD